MSNKSENIGPAKKCLLIAEIGINHNGDINLAKKLIDMSKTYNCDFVKFQKRTIDVVYTPEFLAQPRESPWGTTQGEQKRGLEFGLEEYKEIDTYCKKTGIGWFASAWDTESLEFLDKFDLPHNKLASAMLTHIAFVEALARRGKHTFISTGMCSYEELDEVVNIFRKFHTPFTLMHTTSVYPCPMDRTNIATMLTLKARYKCPVGYSGHESGIYPTMLAACLGAEAIERHITLDRAMYGSDHAASLESRGLEIVSKFTRSLPVAFGSSEKTFEADEVAVAKKLRYFA